MISWGDWGVYSCELNHFLTCPQDLENQVRLLTDLLQINEKVGFILDDNFSFLCTGLLVHNAVLQIICKYLFRVI